jgi:HK97 family phage major capsid protein
MATAPLNREQIAERVSEIEGRMKELTNEFAGQQFSDEARGEWTSLGEERDSLSTLDAELEVREQVVSEFVAHEATTERSGAQFQVRAKTESRDIYDMAQIRTMSSSPEQETRNLKDNAMRAIERADIPQAGVNGAVNKETAQTRAEYILRTTQCYGDPGDVARRILATGSPTYSRAFGKSLAGTPLSADEQRAMSLAGSGGGFAIPFALDPTLIPTSNYVVNPTRALGRVVTISGSNTWQGVTSPTVTATRVAEATEATDNAPTLVQPTATVTKAHAFVPFSIEVSEDWESIQGEMARMIQQGKDEEEGTAFVTGSGTTVNPQGFVTGTTATVAAATGLTVTAANVYALEAALPPRFRPNESFVANRGIYNVIRGIDTAGGAALWLYVSQGLATQAPTPGNTGATLLGRGAWEASAMQATVVNATKIMVVGDFSYFLIVDRIGMNVEVIPHIFGATSRFPIGQRGLYAYWRNTSKVLSASAFVALTGTT